MALLVKRRSFESGWNHAPPHVRRVLLRVLTDMAAEKEPGPVAFDSELTLWVPVQLVTWEYVLPNTGWSLLYTFNDTTYFLHSLCETPVR